MHLLVLTRVLIYCTEWKIYQVWGFCECGNDLHRSAKDASYTVTRPGTVFCETWRSHTRVDEDYTLSTGKGLRTFRWNAVPSSWTVSPEDEVKLTSREGETFQMTWIFTNTAVRISQPPTVVPKRRQETANRRCLKSQRSTDLIYTAFKAWNHATVEVLRFLLSARQENAQTEVGRVFSLLCCSRICWSFQTKENYPTTGKGQEEIGWNPSLVEAGCDEISQLRTEGWTLCLVNILTAIRRTLQCASVAGFFQIHCCVCSEDIMARRV